jgi:hypothetical protein
MVYENSQEMQAKSFQGKFKGLPLSGCDFSIETAIVIDASSRFRFLEEAG